MKKMSNIVNAAIALIVLLSFMNIVSATENYTQEETIQENNNVWIKDVTIAGQEQHQYNVVVCSTIKETIKEMAKLFFIDNETIIDVTKNDLYLVTFHDTNSNSLIDTICWNVPELSTKEFQIIIDNTTTATARINYPDNNSAINKTRFSSIFEINVTPSNISLACRLVIKGALTYTYDFGCQQGVNNMSLELTDGSYELNLSIYFDSNKVLEQSTLFRIDTVAPTIVVNPNINNANIISLINELNITIASSEEVNMSYVLNNIPSDSAYLITGSRTISINPLQGTNTLILTAKDLGGNTRTSTYSFNFSYNDSLFCHDGIKNHDETGIDCGGMCSACIAFSATTDKTEYQPNEMIMISIVARQDSNHTIAITGQSYSYTTNGHGSSNYFLTLQDPGNYIAVVTYKYMEQIESRILSFRVGSQDEDGGGSQQNQTPSLTVDIGVNSAKVKPGGQLNFNAIVSGGTMPYRYRWDFNEDGNIEATTREAAYSYSEPGTIYVWLYVNDSSGLSGQEYRIIRVVEEHVVRFEVKEKNTGNPVSGATIIIDEENSTTNSDGVAELNLLEGNYGISVEKEDYFDYSEYYYITSNDTLKISLEKKNHDIAPPNITLIGPENDAKINGNKATLKYKVKDDSPTNCTLYLGQYANWWSIAKANHLMANDAEESYTTDVLEKGSQYWKLECKDAYGNSNSAERKFSIETEEQTENAIPQSEEETLAEIDSGETANVDQLAAEIESIISNMNSLGKAEIEAADALGLKDELERMLKEVKQIKRDFFNLRYKKDVDMEKEKEDMQKKTDNLRKSVIRNLVVIASDEYVIYPTEDEVEKLTKSYFESANTGLTNKDISKIVKQNRDVQKSATISTKAKVVDLNYVSGETKRITLIDRRIKLDTNETGLSIVEIMPKEHVKTTDDVKFMSDIQIINKDPVVKLKSAAEKGEARISYYINNEIFLEKVREFKTLLTYESVKKKESGSNLITGLAVLDDVKDKVDFKTSAVLSILLSLIVYLLISNGIIKIPATKKKVEKQEAQVPNEAVKAAPEKPMTIIQKTTTQLRPAVDIIRNMGEMIMMKTRKIPIEVTEIENKISLAYTLLYNKEHDKAKMTYNEIKATFRKIKPEYRKRIKDKVMDVYHRLNKAEIEALISEADCKISFNLYEEASTVYPKIRSVAEILPKHMKPEIYSKVVQLGNRINSNYLLGLIEQAHSHVDKGKIREAFDAYNKIQKIYKEGTSEMRETIVENAMDLFHRLKQI
ncbi:hypothetical protein JXA85_01445 [Candidatus Woesearchaeota archaeon]|nr:hypothetical protein [Candidatus Woesearchaeota archaeon]